MAIEAVEFKEKKYIIDGAEFRLRKPTLGIKRKGFALASMILLRLQEIESIGTGKQFVDLEKLSNKPNVDSSVYAELYKVSEEITIKYEETIVESEKLLKIILEPIVPEDIDKLIADNINEEFVAEVVEGFFQIAGLSKMPARKSKKSLAT